MTKLTKLEHLHIDDVSGVDRPASMLDGWAVMKSRGDDMREVAQK